MPFSCMRNKLVTLLNSEKEIILNGNGLKTNFDKSFDHPSFT